MKNKGKICSTKGCGQPAHAKGWCAKCYVREVTYPKMKAKRQAQKEPDKPAIAESSADINAILKPLRKNIAYLRTRRKEIDNWLNTLTKIVEILESR